MSYVWYHSVYYITQAPSELHSFSRGESVIPEQNRANFRAPPSSLPGPSCEVIPEIGQVIRVMPTQSTPDGAFENGEKSLHCLMYDSEIDTFLHRPKA